MREILFRGKRKDSREWVTGYYTLNATLLGTIEEEIYPTIQPFYDRKFEVIPDTVGQYTGLSDVYGTKIFEGDIIALNESEVESSYTVEFFLGAYVCRNIKCHEDYKLCNPITIGMSWKVIGNIYDNPELCEVK